MLRLFLVIAVSIAGFAGFAAPALRAAQAGAIVVPAQTAHPLTQTMNFLLPAPEPEDMADRDELKLWATWYHMPRLRAAREDASGAVAPLLGRNGQPISPPLTRADWCEAAMQGSVWVVDANGAATPYVFVDAKGPVQVDCDAHFGTLSSGIKTATRRARFVAFTHPLGCDIRPIALIPWRTVATDPRVIPMGTVIYVPELRGRAFWMNGKLYQHDGYLVAGDRGGAIKGRHIDIFVPEGEAEPFPDLIASSASRTFAARVLAPDSFAAQALRDTRSELCRDAPLHELVFRPWRKPAVAET